MAHGSEKTSQQHFCKPCRDDNSVIVSVRTVVRRSTSTSQQTRVYPYPLGAGPARPNPKMGAPDPENPVFLGFSVLRGGLRPWSRKGPDHEVGVDPETVNFSQCYEVFHLRHSADSGFQGSLPDSIGYWTRLSLFRLQKARFEGRSCRDLYTPVYGQNGFDLSFSPCFAC